MYLSDELAEAWRASGVRLAELVRRGLDAGPPVSEATLRRVLGEMLPTAGYATTVGTGTAEVPQPPPVPGTALSGTATEVPHSAHATDSGTRATNGGTSAPKAGKAPRRAEPHEERPVIAAAISSVPDLPVPLTVASALPKPPRCNHPGFRTTGGFCPQCDHLVAVGGLWR